MLAVHFLAIEQAFYLWGVSYAIISIILLTLWSMKKITFSLRWFLYTPIILLYFCGVIAVTMLPLPNPEEYTHICFENPYYPRFILGWSLQFAIRDFSSMGIGAILTSSYIKGLILNVALFLPAGIFLALLAKTTWKTTLFASFGLSMLIELTQLTGIWGYYPCAYRTFDAEDLLTNTIGAMIGWSIIELLRHTTHQQPTKN
ncbi:VanZ family protein [Rothia sp. P7208]|uniref:VanZ family protein n=1 Tax=Rothia sp. P7208 TaxID=3402660 RepID=UPI003ACECB86